MRIDLYGSTEAKLEDVMEQLTIRYGLEDLTPEELIDALLDIAVDSVVTDLPADPAARNNLISLCTQKIVTRG
jgi:hypothetical protein